MSKFYIVMAKSGLGNRWMDSFWINQKSAVERCSQLKALMDASGLDTSMANQWWTWIVEAKIEDARIEAGTAQDTEEATA